MYVISLLTCNKNYPQMLFVCNSLKQVRNQLEIYGADTKGVKNEDLTLDSYDISKENFQKINDKMFIKGFCHCSIRLVVSETQGDLLSVAGELWEQNV